MYDAATRRSALARLDAGSSLSEVSRELGVSRSAIRSWVGQPNDGLACPAPAAATPAYAALFGFYLGGGCISRQPRTYSLRIACDRSLPRIVADVESILQLVHPERRTYRVRAPGVTVVQQYWKHWPCLFPQHGSGRKHERELVMSTWQREIVDAYPADFLRGLFHSDGSLVNNWATRVVSGERKRYDYRRWQFVNESTDIMRWCGEALDRVGIAWRQTNRRTLSVSRATDVTHLTSLIGTKS
jgi:hypothetical protein